MRAFAAQRQLRCLAVPAPFRDAMAPHGVKRRRVQDAGAPAGVLDLGGGAEVELRRDVFSGAEADELFTRLRTELNWQQREICIMGKKVMQPRLVVYQGDPGTAYTYSRVEMQPEPWHEALLHIKGRVEAATDSSYNSCLLNLYRGGSDSMSWHSDNEPVYAAEQTIASVSLGATRDFVLRANADHDVKHRFALGRGDVLVMRGSTQQHWQHAVPKRRGEVGERINLTFRQALGSPR